MKTIIVKADLHTHSVASGHAYSTVYENIQVARKRGLELIAITDHGPKMPGAPHPGYFGNLKVLPEEKEGIRLLKGIEANIIDSKGNIDLPTAIACRLDIVLAGFHDDCFPACSEKENTHAILNAICNPLIDIIVHPGNPRFPVDYKAMVEAAARAGVAIELNNSSLTVARFGSKENCLQIASLAGRTGAFVAVGSDAHWADRVGEFNEVEKMMVEAGVGEEQVLNASVNRIMDFLDRRGALKRSIFRQ